MNRLTVASRLAWSFGTLLALLVIVSLTGLWGVAEVNASLDTLVARRAPQLEALNDIAYRVMDNARIVRNLILLTDEKAMAPQKDALDKNQIVNDEHVSYLQANLDTVEDIALLKDMLQRRDAYWSYTTDVIQLGLANKNEEATKVLYGEKYKTQAAYFDAIRKLIDSEKQQMNAASADATATSRLVRCLIVALAALAGLVGSALAFVIARGLGRQLGAEPGYATEVARRIAAGDLSVSIHTRSGDTTSLLAAMLTMRDSLVKLVSSVRDGSESVAAASAQIAQGTQNLSQRTEEQASALEQTAASMEQLGVTVRQNADNSSQANKMASAASAVAIEGGRVVSEVVDTMKGINDSSRKIADIISVIDGIAFQTNILALNAAVEAARAGEQGRGFAVVASEVRSLAGRSADAAKEIKRLINDSVERVERGSELVDRAGVTMDEVVGSIKRVTDIVAEISHASAEQSSGVGQVGEAVTQMDKTTQQNASLVEESAAAAESLRQQAQQLVKSAAMFTLAPAA